MGLDFKFGQMEPSTRVTGKTTRPQVWVFFSMRRETSTKVTFAKTKPAVSVCTLTSTGVDTRASGTMTCRMAMGLRLGTMVHSTKAATSWERNTATGSMSGRTDPGTTVHGR